MLSPNDFYLFILLSANDLALLSTSISSLQNQLNVLYSASCRLGLFANLYKSQIVMFLKPVSGEFSRYALFITSALRCIKYCLSCLNRLIWCIPNKPVIANFHEKGMHTWVTHINGYSVTTVLVMYVFSFVVVFVLLFVLFLVCCCFASVLLWTWRLIC